MKKKLYPILAFVTLLIVYCVLFLVIPFPKSAASWVTFGFTLFAICLCGVVFWYAFGGKEIKSKIYGFPVFKIALIYVAVQFFCGIAICIIAAFVNMPAWIPIVLDILFLAFGVLGFIATDSAKNTIEELDTATANITQIVHRFRLDVSSVIDLCPDAALCEKLRKLEEQFRYSDPVSCAETEEAEHKLQEEMERLRASVESEGITEANALADTIKIHLAERNRLCKMYKKGGLK